MHSAEVTINILDRYMALHVPPEERTMDTMHLLTLTSLYLALKLTTSDRPAPQMFVRLSQSKITAKQVEEAELRVIYGLSWYINPPSAETFAHYYIKVLSEVYPQEILQRVEATTMAYIRSTISDYVWVCFLPSMIAMGALSLSLHEFAIGSPDCFPSPLAELHQRGVYVHQMGSMQCLEYFYRRGMCIPDEGEDPPRRVQPTNPRSAKSGGSDSTRNISPVSIVKDDPAIIADEVD